MGGVVKGFQIACNLAGQLGDLTGRGDQPSRKVVLVTSAVHVKETTSTSRATKEDGGVLKLVKRVSLKSTLHYRK